MTTTGTPDSTGTGTPPPSTDNQPRSPFDIAGLTTTVGEVIGQVQDLLTPTATSTYHLPTDLFPEPTPTEPTTMAGDDETIKVDLLKTLVPAIMGELQKQTAQASTPPPLTKPRVGGTTSRGVWTGLGDPNDPTQPKTNDCYREMAQGMKDAFKTESDIEKTCRKGLADDSTGLLFKGPTEQDDDNFVACFRALKDKFRDLGMEGLFTLYVPGAVNVDYFENPGAVSESMMAEWVQDLTVKGVRETDSSGKNLKGDTDRHAVCKFDKKNLALSGQACLNSCTAGFQLEIKNKIVEKDRIGVIVLEYIVKQTYRPSSSKVEDLKDKLKALDITKYPGEDISRYNSDAIKIIKEIQMNYVSDSQAPNLTCDALKGLENSSVFNIKELVTNLRLSENVMVPGGKTAQDTLEVLNGIQTRYNNLVSLKSYPPAAASKKKAFQAQVQPTSPPEVSAAPAPHAIMHNGYVYVCQTTSNAAPNGLTRVESATSTRGNGASGGSSGGRNPNGMLCLKCNSPNHLANSPDCPLKDQPAHGLSKEVSEECSRLIKEYKLSDRAHIADDAEHHISVNGAIVAKHCRHCGRFVKGKNAHYTKGHKGKNRYAYKPPTSAPAPAPGPAPVAGSANLMTFPEGMDPNSVPVVDSLPSSSGVRWSD